MLSVLKKKCGLIRACRAESSARAAALELGLHEADLLDLAQRLLEPPPQRVVRVHHPADHQREEAVDRPDRQRLAQVPQDEQRKQVQDHRRAGDGAGQERQPQQRDPRGRGETAQPREQEDRGDQHRESDDVAEQDADPQERRLESPLAERADRQSGRGAGRGVARGPEKDL